MASSDWDKFPTPLQPPQGTSFARKFGSAKPLDSARTGRDERHPGSNNNVIDPIESVRGPDAIRIYQTSIMETFGGLHQTVTQPA
jgi:hypothetical protein